MYFLFQPKINTGNCFLGKFCANRVSIPWYRTRYIILSTISNLRVCKPVLRIRIHVFLGLLDLDLDPDPLVRVVNPDASIIKQKW
jgi:hypothetical protein